MKTPFKFRQHRSTVQESLDTVTTFNSLSDLADFLSGVILVPVSEEMLTIRKLGFDSKTGWRTSAVLITGVGVAGFIEDDE